VRWLVRRMLRVPSPRESPALHGLGTHAAPSSAEGKSISVQKMRISLSVVSEQPVRHARAQQRRKVVLLERQNAGSPC